MLREHVMALSPAARILIAKAKISISTLLMYVTIAAQTEI